MRISDWSSDVCSSDLLVAHRIFEVQQVAAGGTQHEVAVVAVEAAGGEVGRSRHGELLGRPLLVAEAALPEFAADEAPLLVHLDVVAAFLRRDVVQLDLGTSSEPVFASAIAFDIKPAPF